jgi:ABC-2 type transport system permease protein
MMLRNNLKVLAAFARQNVKETLAYRVDTLINIGIMLMWQAWDFAGLAIVFSNTETIGGWRIGDMIVLTGIFRLVNMFMFSLVWPSTEAFNRGIREGTLDYTLLLPIDSQFAVTFQKIVVWRIVDLGLAIILILTGLFYGGVMPSLGNTIAFILLLLSGGVVLYSVWVLLIAMTFWFTKFDNNVTLMHALTDAGRYPATIYPLWLRVLVTFVIPIAVATTVPLQALRGELTWWQFAGALSAGLITFVVSRLVWKLGVHRYSGASA